MSSFIIRDVRVFTGEQVIETGSVYVNLNGFIDYVGAECPALPGVPVISRPGYTLLPGLIDAHIHADEETATALQQCAKFGVTTVMDMANKPSTIAKLKEISRTRKDVAHLMSACAGAMVEGGWPAPVILAHGPTEENLTMLKESPKITTPEEAESFVEQNLKNGADYIKILQECGAALGQSYSSFPEPIQAAIVEASHRRGLLCVAHATCLSDTLEVLRAGVDGLMHTLCDQTPTPELIEAYKLNDAFCCPTLGAMGSMTTEGRETAEIFAKDRRVSGMIDQQAKAKMCKCMAMGAKGSSVGYAYESVRQLKAAGIDIICGSDSASAAMGTSYGLSLHHELYLLVHKAGMNPPEALSSATAVTARRFGIKDRGLIEKGRRADLVLVEGNPLKDIGDTLNLSLIWRDGVQIRDDVV
ncbi:hypothetical protein MMC30_008975 [Trapelia coarctata]|nr:hypothetical protein [Trapelia coarctata]